MTYLDKALSYVRISYDCFARPRLKEEIEEAVKKTILECSCPSNWGLHQKNGFSYPCIGQSDGHYCRECWQREYTED